jgi:hypothetical protein
MVNEGLRILNDRITQAPQDPARQDPARHVVFQPLLILGDSCRPLRVS